MPITGKEMVKLALVNGWLKFVRGGVIIILRKKEFPILSLFQSMVMMIWEEVWREKY